MSDDILLTLGEDGVFREYDDTYDVVIHCESQEEQDETKKCLELLNAIYAFKKATKCEEILIVQKDRMKVWDENGKEHTMQPTDVWIPVSERLPEEYEYVLLCDREPEPDEDTDYSRMAVGWIEDGQICCWDDRATRKEFVAWMPLPEPYKPEKRGLY